MKENGIPLEQALRLCQRKKCGNLHLHHSLTRQKPTIEEALECLVGKDIALNRNILGKGCPLSRHLLRKAVRPFDPHHSSSIGDGNNGLSQHSCLSPHGFFDSTPCQWRMQTFFQCIFPAWVREDSCRERDLNSMNGWSLGVCGTEADVCGAAVLRWSAPNILLLPVTVELRPLGRSHHHVLQSRCS